MKERIGTDGIPVVEYELEDIPKLISGELPWVFGLVKTQRNSEGGESTWFRFTPEAEEAWRANKAAQEKGYWEAVNKKLEAAKRTFLHELPKSPDPAETITDRIREGNWRLNPESDPKAVHDLWLFQAVHLGKAWHSLKRGNRNYVDYHHSQLQADIEHKFIKWLEELHEFPPMSKEDFDFEKVKAEVAIQNARDLVDYFTTGSVTVQLFKQGNKYFHEQTEQHLKALSELEQQTAFRPLHRDTLTLLQSSLPETLPTNLKTLLQPKFETQGKPQGFFSLSKFAAHELKRLEQTPYWTDLAHHLPIAEDWKGYLKAVFHAKEQPEQVTNPSIPTEGRKASTGAEIEDEPLDGTRETVANILDPLQDAFITPKDFDEAVNRLCEYFDGEPKQGGQPLRVRRGNIRKLAQALGDIHRDIHHKDGIPKEYLGFAKQTFDCYENQDISNPKVNETNLYKYMTEKK
jgi:hypothetical protein